MTQKNGKENTKNVIRGMVILGMLALVCVLVYKAQLADKMNNSVKCTLATVHKESDTRVLSAVSPDISETFLCTVPDLKKIQIECKGKNLEKNAQLSIGLLDADTGEILCMKEEPVTDIVGKEKSKITIRFPNKKESSLDRALTLTLHLTGATETEINITSNTKPGLVMNYNGVAEDKSNLIYSMHYSNCTDLKQLYAILCVALLLFVALCYWLFIVRRYSIVKAYVPVALLLGLIFNFVIMVHGVPDEPWHIDTAYKYSNYILGIEDTGYAGSIYKRHCDVIMEDMLINEVESNSYYQLANHLWERPADTELVAVASIDTSNQAPGIVFIPCALGISIGRLLGFSALLTLSLGRLMNLLTFVLLTWLAIRLIPYGKNMLGMVSLLPIAMQQGASASYDAVINGVLFLFIASCYKIYKSESVKIREYILPIVLAMLIALVKGGVYLPICLLLVMLYKRNPDRRLSKGTIAASVGIVAVLAALLAIKFMPIFLSIFNRTSEVDNACYSIQYFIHHPAELIYLYWNTLMKRGQNWLMGMLGGKLGWLDYRISWILLIPLLIGLLLLVHVEGDQYMERRRNRFLIGIASVISIGLVMLSMLLAYTPAGSKVIEGIQGRYFVGFMPLLLFLTSTNMVKVKKTQANVIIMAMCVIEFLIVLQLVTVIL